MEKVALKNIIEINKGRQHTSVFSTNGNGKKRYIQIDDLRNDFNLKYTDQTGVEVFPNDLIIAWDGANAGTIGFNLSGFIGSTLARLRITKNNFDAKFLGWYLRSKSKDLRQNCTGATIPHISKSYLESIEIPKIDLVTQKQIAQLLEEAHIARQKRKAANALTDQFLQSTFLSMFGDLEENEKGWGIGMIRDVVSEVKYGTSKPAEEHGAYPYLRMNNIDYNGNWDFSSLKYINLEQAERDKYLLKKGDLVFNRTNSKELVGKTAVYNLDDEMAIAGYLIRVRTNERANTAYLSGYLNSKHGKSTLMAMCKNIVGMANINAQEFQNIRILIPPIELQQKFASIVADTEQLRQKQKQSEIELENLFQALLQKYFG